MFIIIIIMYPTLYKTKKQTLVQEGGNLIQDLLTPVVSSSGFLML